MMRTSRLVSLSIAIFIVNCAALISSAHSQSSTQTLAPAAEHDSAARTKLRNEWFYRGRLVRGKPSAELLRRAYEAKRKLRSQRAAQTAAGAHRQNSLPSAFSSGSWIPLGPVPLASDATGNGTQDYHQVAGRATAVAIDPADPTGNTIYIGGAQSGVWKSVNAANPTANNVTWTPLTDDKETLSIGAISIQPGNTDPAKSVILAATGEANDSADAYFGLGILRSADGGASWTLVSTANTGALSFSGLGGARMAFSTGPNLSNVVVAAMATTAEGIVDGAISVNTTRGLYTSLDAGQSWTYNALTDPGGATDATSATSVVYNDGAGQFFAAVRYHGFYSSPDGVHWTRLASQPGGSLLGTTACPPQSVSNSQGCPIYRGEITTVPGRNEMYAWYISLTSNGTEVDGGIWQSLNGGASWTSISDTAITNCGDVEGCGVQQGSYNLELLAVPDGSATDLYAGAINLYKCSITTLNPTCASSPFLNLTHAYGCDPAGAPAHVHPGQHAVAEMIPSAGGDAGNSLLYFANDGGMYRALDGFLGLSTGSCSGTNAFDDLNENLGSMTQLVTFSQHPTDANTLLSGAQGNGSPATAQATTNSGWGNVLGGDGAYTAIDPATPSNFYASNPDVPPGGLGVQLCAGGVDCNNRLFSFVVTSETVGGDDGGYIFPYILDPQSATAMLVGTCRVWRGPRSGGLYAALSPNFDTLGSGTCSGSEVNEVTALAAAGPTDKNGSSVIYATTSGLGPLDGPQNSPAGGRVWVTTNASAGLSSFADVTVNGPQGNINPNQFPVSSVAVDSSDATGNTAYVTVMGFTGGTGHVWKTTNAGASWTDFTGNLPDSPANAVAVDAASAEIFLATDVGVFASSTSSPSWTEVGPAPDSGQPGFLPNVAVTALGLFNAGGQQLLRASTYGRGMWQFNLVSSPDFQLSISNSPLTVFAGQSASFNGTVTALDGYSNSVALSCVAGTTPPPSSCTPSPLSLVPGNATPFTVAVGGAAGDYDFNVQGVGGDAGHSTHQFPVTLHLLGFGLTTPTPASVSADVGTTSPPVSFQVTAAGSFNQSVTVSCTSAIAGAICSLTPGTTVNPTSTAPVNMTGSVSVPIGTAAGSYPVTLSAATAGASSAVTATFTLVVTSNVDFVLTEPTPFPEVNAGSTGTSSTISIAALDGFSGTVALSCAATVGASSCIISPAAVSSFPATATVTINSASQNAGAGSLTVTATSGALIHTLAVPFNVGDYSIPKSVALAGKPGQSVNASFELTSQDSYSGKITGSCDASALPAAICLVTPGTLPSGGTGNLTVTIDIPNDAAAAVYTIKITTQDSSGTPNHAATVVLTIGQDFEVLQLPPGQSQTVMAGQLSGAYSLTIQPVGASFTGPVTVSCAPSGLPPGAQCLFNQTNATSVTITPNTSAVQLVMNVSTTAGSDARKPRHYGLLLYAPTLLLPLMVIGVASEKRSRRLHVLMTSCLTLTLMLLVSCGGISTGVVNNGGSGGPITYQITVTGTSPGTPADSGQSTSVTLVVD
jgi:hypothetical protein